ncbi:MAG: glutamate synthase-related protein [Candidatus Desantisbacteria bacterium]
MPEKYHISITPTPPRWTPIGKVSAIERDGCLGCAKCAKKSCVYDVYKNRSFDSKQLLDTIDSLCKNCFRCVQECKGRLVERVVNPEYKRLGDSYWKPDIIATTWYQAETGKIPVSGAGYLGPFTGHGFDSMWTDMSEIVRPTRDGIHGREYISTTVDLGRKLINLEFDKEGRLVSNPPPIINIPMPIIFNILPFGKISKNMRLSMAKAADKLGIPMLIEAEEYFDELDKYNKLIMPQFTIKTFETHSELLKRVRLAEFVYEEDVMKYIAQAKKINPELIVSVRVKLDKNAADIAEKLLRDGAEIIHLYADYQGNEHDTPNPRFIKDMVRDIHRQLVAKTIRDEVAIIVSGGIGLAEHLAKIILCGADAAAVDLTLLIALECRVCKRCTKNLSCPVEMEKIETKWASKRIINLMGAWHSQLIEVMGAMGIREARRLRGETGRAMFLEDLERDFANAIMTF